jgi:hypothetical protein
MLPVNPIEIKTRKGPMYMILVVLVFFIGIVMDSDKNQDVMVWVAVLVLMLVGLLLFGLSKLKLIADNDGITQERFFGKSAEIKWSDMASTSLVWHFHGHGANMTWEMKSVSGKIFSLTPSFYSRKDLRELSEIIIGKCPQGSVDKRIVNMAQGKFPWYIF